jgi:hypothetical protein
MPSVYSKPMKLSTKNMSESVEKIKKAIDPGAVTTVRSKN